VLALAAALTFITVVITIAAFVYRTPEFAQTILDIIYGAIIPATLAMIGGVMLRVLFAAYHGWRNRR
jgi:hypothetical protein